MLIALVAMAGCGGDDGGDTPDTNGDLSAKELAAKLPEAKFAQAAAVDVSAAKKAAGQPADANPLELGLEPQEYRLGVSAYFGLRSLSARVANPVRDAFDNALITAYAGRPYPADNAVTLVSTPQPYEEIAAALEEDGWERDGDVLSSDGDPEEVTYTAIAPGEGFIVLGYDPEVVSAVASGDAPPSETGELELLANLDAPAVFADIPSGENLDCVESITYEDPIDGTASISVAIPNADQKNLAPIEAEAESIGFDVTSITEQDDTLEIELKGREDEGNGLANAPATLVFIWTDEDGKPFYDCG